ncbi:MAG: hypothetical protein O2810_01355 [Bacteroidetes bacterium]|nr:hypothetical protein [Bacteroidota bacterium]MDA0888523.1 hypothetical protein [Bacteroidota bacterium]MDA1084166.1 hypothetical protein [Bacteroidota bacterium]
MRCLSIIVTLSFVFAHAQQITILDSISKEPISLVHVFDGKKGVISNSYGAVFWKQEQSDSLTLSCLGYAPKKVAVSQVSDTLYMLPKAMELMPVVVSNRILTAEEIIDSVKANTEKTVDFGLSSSEVFVHATDLVDFKKMDIEIKKSTIPELDQTFVDEILAQVPKNERDESFTKNKWFRDSGGLKHHKLQVLQAATLQDSLTSNQFDSMEKTINEILKKRVKKDSYFKVKSGPLITTKVDNPSKKVDSIEQEESKLTPKKHAADQLGGLQRLATKNLFEEKNWVLPFLANPNKYNFSNEGIVYDLSVPVYKIRFSSKKKKEYNGYLLVDVEDFGVHKILYQSNKHEKRVKLFGLFYEGRLNNRTYNFVKNHLGKYTLYHIFEEYQQLVGLKRPFKIIEKNKVVKGRNRQNVLSMDVNFSIKEVYQKNINFNSFTSITQEEFDAFKLIHRVVPQDFYSKSDVQNYISDFPTE